MIEGVCSSETVIWLIIVAFVFLILRKIKVERRTPLIMLIKKEYG